MPGRDMIVIGASAGGIPALATVVAGLPKGFPASVFIVVHVAPYALSRLPRLLERAGDLPVAEPVSGQPFAPGRVYVAPPDQHLLVREDRIELSRGPRENHTRPAIDPLFRSAARAHGPRVIGVVLSGALYDGSMGLLAVKMRGGVAIVQDPDEAFVDSMPKSALELVAADAVLPSHAIAAELVRLVTTSSRVAEGAAGVDEDERIQIAVREDFAEQEHGERALETTIFTCPECGGVLWQSDPRLLEFRCHVGHRYAPEVLLGQKAEEIEAALWMSLRLLKEKATLSRQLALRARGLSDSDGAERLAERAELDDRHVRAIHKLLEALPTPVAYPAPPTGVEAEIVSG